MFFVFALILNFVKQDAVVTLIQSHPLPENCFSGLVNNFCENQTFRINHLTGKQLCLEKIS